MKINGFFIGVGLLFLAIFIVNQGYYPTDTFAKGVFAWFANIVGIIVSFSVAFEND